MSLKAHPPRSFETSRKVYLEDDVPETPPAEAVSTLGAEVLDFKVADEDLKVEDVVPDLEVPTPEDELARKELRICVNAALNEMPRQWQRALRLRYVSGMKGAALARALGASEPDTGRILERARAFMRQRLVEAGCRFNP
jgi:RNA polymerase sigma factor (sigma-70 family)